MISGLASSAFPVNVFFIAYVLFCGWIVHLLKKPFNTIRTHWWTPSAAGLNSIKSNTQTLVVMLGTVVKRGQYRHLLNRHECNLVALCDWPAPGWDWETGFWLIAVLRSWRMQQDQRREKRRRDWQRLRSNPERYEREKQLSRERMKRYLQKKKEQKQKL